MKVQNVKTYNHQNQTAFQGKGSRILSNLSEQAGEKIAQTKIEYKMAKNKADFELFKIGERLKEFWEDHSWRLFR